MCIDGGDQPQLADPAPKPEKSALPSDIGDARKAEDEQLFGGKPDLAAPRTSTAPTAITGSGLNPMGQQK